MALLGRYPGPCILMLQYYRRQMPLRASHSIEPSRVCVRVATSLKNANAGCWLGSPNDIG